MILTAENDIQMFIDNTCDTFASVDHDNMIVFYINGEKVYLCECIDIFC